MRDYASAELLVVLANLARLKVQFIRHNLVPKNRLEELNSIAIELFEILLNYSKKS